MKVGLYDVTLTHVAFLLLFTVYLTALRNLESSVGIAKDCGIGDRGFDSR
jgi:hypothetical protein